MGFSEPETSDSERYYIVFALYSFDNCILVEASYFKSYCVVEGGFLKPQKPPLYAPDVYCN